MSDLTVKIENDKGEMPDNFVLTGIDIVTELNKIPFAGLILLNRTNDKEEKWLSDENFFLPGTSISISVKGDRKSVV